MWYNVEAPSWICSIFAVVITYAVLWLFDNPEIPEIGAKANMLLGKVNY